MRSVPFDIDAVRPQRDTGEMSQAGNGCHVGPGPSGQQVGDGLPVDSGAGRGRPQAQPEAIEGLGEGSGDLADRFGGRIGDDLLGPGFRVLGELPGGACAGASANHARTTLSVVVDQLWNGCLSSRYAWTVVLDPDTSAKITRYRPREAPPLWVEVAPLVRSVVAATVTAVPYDVEQLLHVTGRLALWAEASGLERSADAWLRNEVIDAFVLSRAGDIEGSSVRTYRTWLLRVRDALAWSERGEAAPARMHAEANTYQPYTAAELAGLRHWATHLPRQQKTDALALMGLGAGLGLMPKEVAASRGADLQRLRGNGPLLHTAVDRLVPLVARAAWDTVLGELADQAGLGYLFRPRRTTEYAKNLIGSWSLTHLPPDGLPTVSVGRLRATWIVELMRAHIDHHLIAQAAGLASAASLARWQHLVPPLDDATAARLLRGPER